MFSAAEADGFDLGGRDQALVCGIETHVCVNQTVLDLLAGGTEVHVAEDAVGSRFDDSKRIGLAKMEQAGAVLTSVETALFELLGRAGHRRVQGGPEADPGVRPQPGRRGRGRSVSGGIGEMTRATCSLEDGTRLDGELCGDPGTVTGEVVFNTSMTGYQEAVTDPSYAGQIITFTYPLIGNYGVSARGDGVRPGPRPRRDHARGQELRGRRERRGRLARLAARLRGARDHRRRHAGAGAPHPRPAARCAAASSRPSWPRPRRASWSRPSRRWTAPTWPASVTPSEPIEFDGDGPARRRHRHRASSSASSASSASAAAG